MRILMAIATVLFALAPYPLSAQAPARKPSQQPDVIYVPTPHEVVDDMLRLANVGKGDVLYDLGSGDGRIAIAAAKKFGIKAVGIDIDPERIKEATENAKKAGVGNLVEFRNEDLFKADFKEATVVTLYLLPDLNVKLRPRLWEDLKPGTRIVSHQFDMGTWKPEKRLDSERPHGLLLDHSGEEERSEEARPRSGVRRGLPVVLHRQAAPGESARAPQGRISGQRALAAVPAQSRTCPPKASRARSTARPSSAPSSARSRWTRA